MKHISHKEALELANSSRKRCGSRSESGGKALHEWTLLDLPDGQLLEIAFDGRAGVTSCRVGTEKEFEAAWDIEWGGRD